jgi:hypothetical protein
MSGEGSSNLQVAGWGIKVYPDHYVLFSGSYVDGAENNTVVTAPSGLNFGGTLTNSEIIFARGSGEIINYSALANTLTLTASNQTQTIRFNQYGVITGD